jgi:hypothetical protein
MEMTVGVRPFRGNRVSLVTIVFTSGVSFLASHVAGATATLAMCVVKLLVSHHACKRVALQAATVRIGLCAKYLSKPQPCNWELGQAFTAPDHSRF